MSSTTEHATVAKLFNGDHVAVLATLANEANAFDHDARRGEAGRIARTVSGLLFLSDQKGWLANGTMDRLAVSHFAHRPMKSLPKATMLPADEAKEVKTELRLSWREYREPRAIQKPGKSGLLSEPAKNINAEITTNRRNADVASSQAWSLFLAIASDSELRMKCLSDRSQVFARAEWIVPDGYHLDCVKGASGKHKLGSDVFPLDSKHFARVEKDAKEFTLSPVGASSPNAIAKRLAKRAAGTTDEHASGFAADVEKLRVECIEYVKEYGERDQLAPSDLLKIDGLLNALADLRKTAQERNAANGADRDATKDREDALKPPMTKTEEKANKAA